VKTLGSVDLGDASLQTSLAVTTLPSAASLRPASPIHCNEDAMMDEETYKILSSILKFLFLILKFHFNHFDHARARAEGRNAR